MAPRLVILGTMAFDDIATPFGEVKNALGGSATYAGVAASLFTSVGLISVVGADFPEKELLWLQSRGIDVSGVQRREGKTFRWSGKYEYDMNVAHTLDTELNVLSDFDPKVPGGFVGAEFLFLGNLDPDMQMSVLGQVKPKFATLDTMNYWLGRKRRELEDVIRKVNAVIINEGEARELCRTPNLVQAAKMILKMGPQFVVVKKGEHGALLFTNEEHFSAPAYPLEQVVDPTGAGDSFAGGVMGWLAKGRKAGEGDWRKAIVRGSAIASYNAEHFGLNKLRSLTVEEVEKRVAKFKEIAKF